MGNFTVYTIIGLAILFWSQQDRKIIRKDTLQDKDHTLYFTH